MLKVVNYYYLSVLSMSVMGFPKRSLGGVGGVSSIQVCFGFLEFFNFVKPLKVADNLYNSSSFSMRRDACSGNCKFSKTQEKQQ